MIQGSSRRSNSCGGCSRTRQTPDGWDDGLREFIHKALFFAEAAIVKRNKEPPPAAVIQGALDMLVAGQYVGIVDALQAVAALAD